MGLDQCQQTSLSPLLLANGESILGAAQAWSPPPISPGPPPPPRPLSAPVLCARDFFPFHKRIKKYMRYDRSLDTRAECVLRSLWTDGGAPHSNPKGVTWDYDNAYRDGSPPHFVTNDTVWVTE